MEEADLERDLNIELKKYSDNAIVSMTKILASVPENAVALNFEIFPAQDGDGFFSIRANLDGPDLYVLNKAIDPVADIFNPKYTQNGIEPFIPTVDPFDIDYQANDIVVDCAANWLKVLWNQIDSSILEISVYIVGHEDYGNVTPIQLK